MRVGYADNCVLVRMSMLVNQVHSKVGWVGWSYLQTRHLYFFSVLKLTIRAIVFGLSINDLVWSHLLPFFSNPTQIMLYARIVYRRSVLIAVHNVITLISTIMQAYNGNVTAVLLDALCA